MGDVLSFSQRKLFRDKAIVLFTLNYAPSLEVVW
jgi:hypothetical protein